MKWSEESLCFSGDSFFFPPHSVISTKRQRAERSGCFCNIGQISPRRNTIRNAKGYRCSPFSRVSGNSLRGTRQFITVKSVIKCKKIPAGAGNADGRDTLVFVRKRLCFNILRRYLPQPKPKFPPLLQQHSHTTRSGSRHSQLQSLSKMPSIIPPQLQRRRRIISIQRQPLLPPKPKLLRFIKISSDMFVSFGNGKSGGM